MLLDTNIYTVTSTNAHFLKATEGRETVKSGLDRIIISIDGTTQEHIPNIVLAGVWRRCWRDENLVEAKKILQSKTPHIVFQFIVMRQPASNGRGKAIGQNIG